MWGLLAQSGNADIQGWISAATAIGSLGIATWFLYYTVAVRQPREDAAKASEQDANRKHVETVVKEIKAECRQEKEALMDVVREQRAELAKERASRDEMEREWIKMDEERKNNTAALISAINRLNERVDTIGKFRARGGEA